MGGVGVATDKDLCLGSVYRSMEHLPRWYQVIALCGLFFLFPIREIAVIGWLAASLHSSFGTEIVWSEEYQRLLEQMSFNERICFTLYGVALSLLAFGSYKVFARGTIHQGLQECGLTGGRKWWPAAIVCGCIGCEAMAFLKEIVTTTLSDTTSPAHFALEASQGTDDHATFIRFLGSINPHLIIQWEVLKLLLLSFLERTIPAVIVGCSYRLVRDVPRRAHAALRWYLVTLMLSRSLVEVHFMYWNNEWDRMSSWILFVSTSTILGMVNYSFGPSKRGGWTAATSLVSSIHQTLEGIVKCTALLFVICLCVLALVVSVHVVELLLIWLIFFLMSVWVPAIIDSCSIEYTLCIVTVICFIAHQMEYLTDMGSIRLWGVLSLWWLNFCLFYNFFTNLCRSRYGGIVAVSIVIVVVWRMQDENERTGDFVSLLENTAAELRDIVESVPSVNKCGGDVVLDNARLTSFTEVMKWGFTMSVVLILSITFLGFSESQEVRSRLLGETIFLVTPGVLFRKLVKSLILGVCFFIFIVAGILMYHFLPQFAMFAPDVLILGIAVGLACTILGSLMDMQEFLYQCFMRAIGVMDPPAGNDDDKDVEEILFPGGLPSSLTKR